MEQNYISGLFCKKNEKAPEFVLCNLDIKVDEFIKWLQDNKNERGYINLQVLNSKQGKPYIKKNDFKKEESTPTNTKPQQPYDNELPPINTTPQATGDLPF